MSEKQGKKSLLPKDAQVNGFKEELAGMKDSFARLQADYENHIKRVEKQKEALWIEALARAIKSILPPIDSLEIALKNLKDLPAAQSQGLELVLKHFYTALEQQGVSRIKTEGEKFNPYFHEAVSTVYREELPEGLVVEETLPGYVLKGDRVLRCAQVIVSKEKENQGEDE